jgi:hypothetical protein
MCEYKLERMYMSTYLRIASVLFQANIHRLRRYTTLPEKECVSSLTTLYTTVKVSYKYAMSG